MNKKFLISEIKNNNLSALKTMEKIGEFLFEINDLNFYLTNKNKYDELIYSDNYQNLYEYEENKINCLVKRK